MKPLNLSYYIINKFSIVSDNGISPLKIQKLLYYVYVWGIVNDKKFFNEKFFKWSFGPVLPEVYQEFKSFGDNPIQIKEDYQTVLNNNEQKFVDFIVSNYIKFDAITLSSMTHQDNPWKQTKLNKEINESLIKEFYSKLNFAKNFPIDPNKPYYPVATDLHYSFIMDFSEDAPEFSISYKSYNDYLEIVKTAKTDFNNVFSTWFAI